MLSQNPEARCQKLGQPKSQRSCIYSMLADREAREVLNTSVNTCLGSKKMSQPSVGSQLPLLGVVRICVCLH